MFYPNLMGLITFSGAFLLMILTVPWQQVKRYNIFGVIGGFGVGVALLLVMQNWLGLWVYHRVDFLSMGGIPLILSAAWTPPEIFFAHFLSRISQPLLRILLILFIPAIAVGMHFVQILNHMLTYYHWNLFATYILSLVIHSGIAYYLNRFYTVPLIS